MVPEGSNWSKKYQEGSRKFKNENEGSKKNVQEALRLLKKTKEGFRPGGHKDSIWENLKSISAWW